MLESLLTIYGFYIVTISIFLLATIFLYTKLKKDSFDKNIENLLFLSKKHKGATVKKSQKKEADSEKYKKYQAQINLSNKKNLRDYIEKSGITVKFSLILFIALDIIIFLLFIKFTDSSPLSSLFNALLITCIFLYLMIVLSYNRIIKQTQDSFPEILDMLSRRLKSGGNLTEAFYYLSQETASPVWKKEFDTLYMELEAGNSLSSALERSEARINLPEYRTFCSILIMQKKLGGGLSSTIENLSAVIRDKKIINEKIKALSSQATATANFIGALPLFGLGLLYFNNPLIIDEIQQSKNGVTLFIFTSLLYLIGIVILKMVTNIKA